MTDGAGRTTTAADYAHMFETAPDLQDMAWSGVEPKDAVALLALMEEEDHPPEYWWAIILPTAGTA